MRQHRASTVSTATWIHVAHACETLRNKVGHAEFEAAPVCVQPCQPGGRAVLFGVPPRTPDHQQGTLDVSGCMNDCVPGDKAWREWRRVASQACSCEVHCASGNYHVDGGREGAKACTASASGTPRWRRRTLLGLLFKGAVWNSDLPGT